MNQCCGNNSFCWAFGSFIFFVCMFVVLGQCETYIVQLDVALYRRRNVGTSVRFRWRTPRDDKWPLINQPFTLLTTISSSFSTRIYSRNRRISVLRVV